MSEQKTAEYTVSPSVSSDGWQFVSTTFVPPQAENGQTVTPDALMPIYLRLPQAERELKAKNAQKNNK